MKCPFPHGVREGLPPLTDRINKLPLDDRGYPVPFFVAWVDGKADFRVADPAKMAACVRQKVCWTCGEPLGAHKAFIVGPMCAITRTVPEPPNHLDCAEWSVKGCPFLSRPQMVRREDDFTESLRPNDAGLPIMRNPGAVAIWVTKDYSRFRDQKGHPLFTIGAPIAVSWWREGRPATRAEVLESMNSGYPLLEEMCLKERTPQRVKESLYSLNEARQAAMELIPAV